jgi:hypothetical protein
MPAASWNLIAQGHHLAENDPFISLDQDGVGELVKIGVERGRKTRPDLKLGICGEHGGDPASIAFCHEDRARLCVVLAVPRADRASRRRAGRARQREKPLIPGLWPDLLPQGEKGRGGGVPCPFRGHRQSRDIGAFSPRGRRWPKAG